MELLKTERLEILVNALGKLRKHEINMSSIQDPTCGTVACHAGDIWLVRDKLPGFMQLYGKKHYMFDYVDIVTLSWLKGLKHREHLGMSEWLRENPKLHSTYSEWVFHACSAFTGCVTVRATQKHILDFWKDVLMRHLIYKEYLKGE